MSGSSALGDLVRALVSLRPEDEATEAAIARLMSRGSAPHRADGSVPARANVWDPAEVRPSVAPEAEGAPPATAPADPFVRPRPLPTGLPVAATLTRVGDAPMRAPAWLREAPALPPPDLDTLPPPPHEPLLAPVRTRAVLSRALGTTAHDGPLHLERVLLAVAQGRVFRDVPRRARATLNRGVQVLVDRSDALLPFAADVRWLLRRIEDLAGAARLEVLRVEGSPLRVVARRRRAPYEEHLPATGTVVLAVTEMGVTEGGPRVPGVSAFEWRRLAARLRQRGCTLRALVPYPEARWPAGLARELAVFPWDRGTGVHTIGRALARPGADGG